MKVPATIKLYDSVEEAAERRDFVPRGHQNVSWRGGTFEEAFHSLRYGNEAWAKVSEGLLERLEDLHFYSPLPLWEASIAGFIPDVPAYLSGAPASMRLRRKRLDTRGPLTILADIFASCNFSKDEITSRGAAILALVRVLSRLRPISLYVILSTTAYSGKHGAVGIRVDTSPLSLSHAAWLLCAPEALRQVVCNLLEEVFPSRPFPPLSVPLAKLDWGLDGEVLYIPGIVSDGRMLKAPQEWILEKLHEAAGSEAEERTKSP